MVEGGGVCGQGAEDGEREDYEEGVEGEREGEEEEGVWEIVILGWAGCGSERESILLDIMCIMGFLARQLYELSSSANMSSALGLWPRVRGNTFLLDLPSPSLTVSCALLDMAKPLICSPGVSALSFSAP